MRKISLVLLTMVLVVGALVGCGSNSNGNNQVEPATNSDQAALGQYADGAYFAAAEVKEDAEWQEVVALQVEGGKIVAVTWNAFNKNGGIDKRTLSEKGIYGMVAKGKASAEWHEQAAELEAFLIEKQDPAAITLDAEGNTDAVSGVSITASGFAQLVDAALKAGVVERGAYKDGHYYAEAAEFAESSGWKETVDITVMNGNIVAASWNGVHKDGGTDKVERSKSGEYGMVAKGNAAAEWHEQALSAEKFLLEKQDPAAIAYDDGGYTDAISGVSIHVNGFVDLAVEALKDAK